MLEFGQHGAIRRVGLVQVESAAGTAHALSIEFTVVLHLEWRQRLVVSWAYVQEHLRYRRSIRVFDSHQYVRVAI